MVEEGLLLKLAITVALFSGIILLLPSVIQVLLQITCTNHVMELSLRDPQTSST